jgi:hypothetical protein
VVAKVADEPKPKHEAGALKYWLAPKVSIEELSGVKVETPREADVLVVGGKWENELSLSTASLMARIYGLTLAHESYVKALSHDKPLSKSISFAQPNFTPRLYVSSAAQKKHSLMWKALERAAKDFACSAIVSRSILFLMVAFKWGFQPPCSIFISKGGFIFQRIIFKGREGADFERH